MHMNFKINMITCSGGSQNRLEAALKAASIEEKIILSDSNDSRSYRQLSAAFPASAGKYFTSIGRGHVSAKPVFTFTFFY